MELSDFKGAAKINLKRLTYSFRIKVNNTEHLQEIFIFKYGEYLQSCEVQDSQMATQEFRIEFYRANSDFAERYRQYCAGKLSAAKAHINKKILVDQQKIQDKMEKRGKKSSSSKLTTSAESMVELAISSQNDIDSLNGVTLYNLNIEIEIFQY